MKRCGFELLFMLFILLLSWRASGQGLVDLAASEQERRQSNREERRESTSFTNIGVERGRPPVALFDCYCTKREAHPEKQPSFFAHLQEEDRLRALAWQSRKREYLASYREQRSRLQRLTQLKRACNEGGVSAFWREPYGNEWSVPSWGLGQSVCEAIPQALRETELTLERIQAGMREDARKLRIPPGLARLE